MSAHQTDNGKSESENERLKAINAELLNALKFVDAEFNSTDASSNDRRQTWLARQARAAIQKATQ